MDLVDDEDDDDDANSDFDVEDERKDSHEKKINLSVINRAGAVKELQVNQKQQPGSEQQDLNLQQLTKLSPHHARKGSACASRQM